MKNNIFSSLVSITKGLHRDNRSEREFQLLLSEIKLYPLATNAVFKIHFKRPLNSKKEYYQKSIFNETEKTIVSFISDFPENATTSENNYSYTILHNKFDKYLNDIASYISKREITVNLSEDIDYIINYLKVSVIRLYAELQEQYGQYSEHDLFTIPEIAEKYFNDSEFDAAMIEKINAPKKEVVQKPLKPARKPNTSFGFKNRDTSGLFKVIQDLQLKIDLLQNNTKVEDLHKLLISKDFTEHNFEIHLQCETTQFIYILYELKRYFVNLNPTSIHNFGRFKTKTGETLRRGNIYKNKIEYPKQKEEIDKIIQQLQ